MPGMPWPRPFILGFSISSFRPSTSRCHSRSPTRTSDCSTSLVSVGENDDHDDDGDCHDDDDGECHDDDDAVMMILMIMMSAMMI